MNIYNNLSGGSMKNMIASSMILLLLFSANSYSQNWINAGNFPSDYFSGYQGGHGVAVDPDGKLWVQFYDASEYVYDPISDTWIPCRAVYVFNPDGTPASFSPITTVIVNGITDFSSVRIYERIIIVAVKCCIKSISINIIHSTYPTIQIYIKYLKYAGGCRGIETVYPEFDGLLGVEVNEVP